MIVKNLEQKVLYLRKRLEDKSRRGTDVNVNISMSEYQLRVRDKLVKAISLGELKTEQNSCPNCGADDGDIIASYDRMGIPLDTAVCRTCPTLYSMSRFDHDSMRLFYADWYRSLSSGTKAPDTSFYRAQAEAGYSLLAFLRSKNLLDVLPRRVLDVGCGAGGALLPFAELGAECVGIDMDNAFLEIGRSAKIDLKVANLESYESERPFDLVILDDVIEHLTDPLGGLKQVRSLLSRDGLVVCQVPVLDTLRELGYRNDLRRYFQLAHVNHFSIASLTEMFSKVEMECIAFDGVGQFAFRVSAQNQCVGPDALLRERERLIAHLFHVTRWRSYYSIREQIATRVYRLLRRIAHIARRE